MPLRLDKEMAKARDSEGRRKTKIAQDKKAAQERKAVRVVPHYLCGRSMSGPHGVLVLSISDSMYVEPEVSDLVSIAGLVLWKD